MKQRSDNCWLVALLFGSLLIQDLAFANPVFVPQFLSGGTGRNIRHLPCVSRRTGETGICMFAFTCAKANGTHLGTCIDRFYFGSCCKIDEEPDIFPQDNTIDIDSSASLPKPYDTTTTTQTPESNDIPGNVDVSKPSTKPNFQAESVATQSTESTTAKINESTKTKPSKLSTKKPIVTEFTTESIRLSTFQSVQNASEQRPITTPSSNTVVYTKRPQRPTTADQKPTATKPKPTSPPYLSTNSTAAIPSTTLSLSTLITGILSLKPVASTASSLPTDQQYVSSKRPATTVGLVQRPTTTLGTTLKPELVDTTIPSYSTTPHRNVTSNIFSSTTNKLSTKKETELSSSSTTTQRTTSITRFPPRNATTVIPTTSVKLSNKPGNTTITTQKTTEANQKPLVTRKPSITTKKPVKVTTKRPSTVTKRPPLLTTTRRSTTSSSVTISSTSSNLTKVTSTLNPTTINAAANSSSSISTTIASTRKPATTLPTKRPATTRRPIVTTAPRTTTTVRRPTITTLKRNFTSSISPRPTTATSTNLPPTTTTTHKPSTTTHHAPSSVIASESGIETTTTKSTTPKIKNTTTVGTKVTQKPTTEILEIPVSTSTAATVKDTTVSSTTAKSTTLSSTEPNRNSSTESYTTSPTVALLTNQNNSTISLSGTTTTSTIINEIDAEFNEMDQTTIVPGIVTWSSFSEEMENSTKIHESSSSVPDTAETEWTPITTPDGWIIIQSPTTENVASEEETEVKPILSTIAAPVASAKPATESTTTTRRTTTTTTTTQRVTTTQPTTYVDMLSTLATVTVSPDFTEPPVESLNMSNYKDVCGRRLFPEPRIVGGDGSTFGKWPWQISLRQWRTTSYLHKCGAALLNENWAITAAHCVQNVLPTDLLLRMGEHDLGNEKEPYVFQERRVQIVASHPNFDPRTFEFDLALMRFYEPILPFQPNVLPICIPDDDEDHVGRTAFVTGWGRLYEDGPLPSVLQEVAVPIINNSVCEGMYRNAGYIEHIPHIFICAGWRKGGFDSCEGDSGGPLVIQRKRDKRWVLAGVISWGIGCAEPNQPGVYTRISEFREWINQILQF